MTMTAYDAPRAWVGCLGCYNEGNLVGEWLDDADEIREYRCPRPKTVYNLHEELWVMDHENMPVITGECSPAEFADAIEWLDGLDAWQPIEAVAVWLADTGGSWRDADLDDFEEAYAGQWDSEEEFAENLAADCAGSAEEAALVRGEGHWPFNNCIDWSAAARDLFCGDYWRDDSTGYVFRRY